MIGRSFRRNSATEEVEAKGFDAFELRLGDLMRGERATLGKSLLDVQRELKIKAAYIAAIENSDPTAFDTPGFIAGYVRSYARYLKMDPDAAFETFCRESGFITAHGMSSAASAVKPTREERLAANGGLGKNIFADHATPFIPSGEMLFAGFEPRALGSVGVLIALIGGLGYGGWSMLQEVQRVRLAPIEQVPTVIADVDPLAGGARATGSELEVAALTPAPAEVLDRLYRPQALDVPVLVPRDGPIASLSPSILAPRRPGQDAEVALSDSDIASLQISPMLAALDAEQAQPQIEIPEVLVADANADAEADAIAGIVAASGVQVTETPAPPLTMVAVRPAWVRVKSADGTTLFEGIMNAGDSWEVPAMEDAPNLRVGESGAVYFAVAGTHYGPVGPRGTVTSNLALSVDNLTATYQVADLNDDSDLAVLVNVAEVVTTE